MHCDMTDAASVRELVARELSLIENTSRREALRALLVDPREDTRYWNYGAPEQRYPYWVVAESAEPPMMLVYCEHGFGPEMPWGFLMTGGSGHDSLGIDAQWDWSLEGAFVYSGLWEGPIAYGDEAFERSPEKRGLR